MRKTLPLICLHSFLILIFHHSSAQTARLLFFFLIPHFCLNRSCSQIYLFLCFCASLGGNICDFSLSLFPAVSSLTSLYFGAPEERGVYNWKGGKDASKKQDVCAHAAVFCGCFLFFLMCVFSGLTCGGGGEPDRRRATRSAVTSTLRARRH